MQRKKLSHREFAKRFDSIAHSFDKIYNPYAVERRSKEIAKFTKGRCLEVGTATGNTLYYLKNKKDYVHSDISLKMCQIAKQKHNPDVVCCDAEKLPFQDISFDTIIASEVLYYLNKPENFINEARRILKDKGTLILSIPNNDMRIYDKIRSLLRIIGFKYTYFDDGVRDFIKLNKMKQMLNINKFKVKIIKKIVFFPFKSFDRINLFIEKTLLNYFCVFIFIVAEKT